MAENERTVSLSWRGIPYECRIVTADRPQTTEPLLIVGGGVQDVHAWPRLERRLTAHTAVIVPKLPDLDDAPDPTEHDFDTFIDALCHALDELGIERVNFLGVSYGAPLAFRMARAHPGRVARLLLAGATPSLNPAMAVLTRDLVERPRRSDDEDLERTTDEVFAKRIVSILLNSAEADDIDKASTVNRMLHRYFMHHAATARRYIASHRLLLDQELYPPGGLDGVPALVFTGEHDQTSTPEEARAVAATISGSTFLLIKNADHMAHLEREAEYADLVIRFIHDRSLDGLDYCTPPERPHTPSSAAPVRT
ncbi:hydrolase [Streptomyces ruber]|uniref:Hydrolase n=2 Tax=Streptomyces TaxID=1883 RepID=A0A918BKF1_9ACTN|nr:alpha/beta hydrolase [Streptomyces ruber]GGQ75771.1 hydrolase [Streptomyces ruber]